MPYAPITPPPLGNVALTTEVLASMSQTERDFWDQFYEAGKKEINANKAAGIFPPYAPSSELKTLALTAVEKYNGLQYCHVRQLFGIFNIC